MSTEATFLLKFSTVGGKLILQATDDLKNLGKEFDAAKQQGKQMQDDLLGLKNITDVLKDINASVKNMADDIAKFDTQNIQEGINQAKGASGQLRDELLQYNQAAQSFQTLNANLQQLTGGFQQADASNRENVEVRTKLANNVPMARDALAKGLYQVISNGVPEDNWISFLQASAKSSIGGLADLQEVVKVTSTIIKNYDLDWQDAMSIQDKIQLTAKNGVTSFEQLAQALPRVTSNASVLGVSIDELMATFSTLTGVSGNTAEVSTQLAAIFTALVKPSSEAPFRLKSLRVDDERLLRNGTQDESGRNRYYNNSKHQRTVDRGNKGAMIYSSPASLP